MKNRLEILPELETITKDELFDILLSILTPSGTNDRKQMSPRSKDPGFYDGFESDVVFCSNCLNLN